MGIFNLFDPVLNFVFGPILLLPSFVSLFIITFIISLVITLSYKYMTDQNLMKQLKDELKEFQKELKELKSHPEKAMKVQKKMMDTNMKYMAQSMRPTFITFIPIIIIFGWLSAHLAYLPLHAGEEFSVDLAFKKNIEGNVTLEVGKDIEILTESTQKIIDQKVRFGLRAEPGEYLLTFTHYNDVFTKRVLVGDQKKYLHPIKRSQSFIDYIYSQNDGFLPKGDLQQIQVNNAGLKPLGEVSIFGWKPGWLGVYIILSIIFSMSLRKLMKIY